MKRPWQFWIVIWKKSQLWYNIKYLQLVVILKETEKIDEKDKDSLLFR